MMASSRNPFVDDICFADPGEAAGTSVPIYRGAIDRIVGELPDGEGATGARVILLLAPRAGFGKSHLLSSAIEEIGKRAMPVRLEFGPDCPVTWSEMFSQLLRAFESSGATGSKETRLDIAVRYLLARANRNLIDAGVIPCSNRWEADSALARDFVELFDFSDPNQVVAKWFGANFHKLVPHAGRVIGREIGMGAEECAAWLTSLCAYAESVGDATAKRSEALSWGILNQPGGSVRVQGMEISSSRVDGELGAKNRTLEFCRLVSLHKPIIFLLDHLDGFYGDQKAGHKIAYFISELQQHLPRKLTILSLNEDLWDSSFRPGLPSAFEDRLTGNVINLTGVDCGGARALVSARLKDEKIATDEADRFLSFLRLDDYFVGQAGKLISPRVVLRYAALHWDVFSGQAGAPSEGGADDVSSGEEMAQQDPFLLYPDEGEESAADASVLGEEIQGVIASSVDGLEDKAVDRLGTSREGIPSAGLNPFQRLKGMLLELREERLGRGVAAPCEVSEPSIYAPEADAGSVDPESPDAAILKEFFEARSRLESCLAGGAAPLAVDVQKVRNLVRIAGRRFPVVSYDEFELPESGGQGVVKWAFGGNEIYFGFEDGSREDFWICLADFVGARTEGDGRGEPSGLKAKIVAFSAPGGEETFHSIRNGDTPWDVICLERSALAALYAADE
ncbi:MAG: hypothetical protein P8J87_00455, partial [Verrucomicrobiales bacterium]|nr:hypothetical protein [Verrucomicrobiales bacterium]